MWNKINDQWVGEEYSGSRHFDYNSNRDRIVYVDPSIEIHFGEFQKESKYDTYETRDIYDQNGNVIGTERVWDIPDSVYGSEIDIPGATYKAK